MPARPTITPPMSAFLKMHGLGNDFVVFDARDSAFALSAAQAKAVEAIPFSKYVNSPTASSGLVTKKGRKS